MAITDDLGLRALISACKFCPFDTCDCTDDLSKVREEALEYLDPAHQIDQKTFNAICHDLDKHPHSHSFPTISPGDEKQRDDGEFERSACAAFNTFRELERDFLLKVPVGPLRHDNTTTNLWWDGAAHLRHHVEFLLVLKGVKPCILFCKNTTEHNPIFSTVIIDILVPIMEHFRLWSYGFKISFESYEWVFYDTRSPLLPQVTKVFLTDWTTKKVDKTGAYAAEDSEKRYLVPRLEVAHTLGYPIRSDATEEDGCYVNIQDASEIDVLESMGRPYPHCCVYGMGFGSPVGNEDDWMKILTHYHNCEEAARKCGTKLRLVLKNDKMTAWLARNPGWIVGPAPWLGTSGPKLREIAGTP